MVRAEMLLSLLKILYYLLQMKEMAVNAVNPHLYTIATLTGHACLSAGDYAIGKL